MLFLADAGGHSPRDFRSWNICSTTGGGFCLLLKQNKTSNKRAAGPWGPTVGSSRLRCPLPGWQGGCFWAAQPPPAVGNWIQLPPAPHKGPIEGGGEAAPSQHQLPPLFTASQKPLKSRPGKRERSRHLLCEGKEPAGAGSKGGPPAAGSSPAWG